MFSKRPKNFKLNDTIDRGKSVEEEKEKDSKYYSVDEYLKSVENFINTFDSYLNFGKNCAEAILNNGGRALMESIRRDLKK